MIINQSSYKGEVLPKQLDYFESPEIEQSELIEDRIETKKYVKEHMGYNVLCEEFDKLTVDSIVTVLTNAICSQKENLRIGGEYIPHMEAKRSLYRFDYTRAESVLTRLKNSKTEIHNAPSYLLTAVYNAGLSLTG